MEKSTTFSGFSGEAAADLEWEIPASNSCPCPKTLQWTTSNYRAPEAPWSLSPFSYTASNQSCLCLRYRNMEYGTSKIKTSSSRFDTAEEEPPIQQKAHLSISKNLKFGIERILTPESFKAEEISGRYYYGNYCILKQK